MHMDELKAQKIWFCWNYETRKDKKTKVPKSAYGTATGTSAEYAHSWVTYDEAAAAAKEPIDKLRSLMEKIEATETEVQQVVSDKGHYPADTPITDYSDKFITGWLIKYWPQITQIICTNRMVEN